MLKLWAWFCRNVLYYRKIIPNTLILEKKAIIIIPNIILQFMRSNSEKHRLNLSCQEARLQNVITHTYSYNHILIYFRVFSKIDKIKKKITQKVIKNHASYKGHRINKFYACKNNTTISNTFERKKRVMFGPCSRTHSPCIQR